MSKVDELREVMIKNLNDEGWLPHHLAAAEKEVDALISAVLDDDRPCCNRRCRNKEVSCPGDMELHWVCTTCGHQHHATKPEE